MLTFAFCILFLALLLVILTPLLAVAAIYTFMQRAAALALTVRSPADHRTVDAA